MTIAATNLIPKRSSKLILSQGTLEGSIEDIDLKRGVNFEINVTQRDNSGDVVSGQGVLTGAALGVGAGKIDSFSEDYNLDTSTGGGWSTYYGTSKRFDFTLSGLSPADSTVEIVVNYWVGA